MKTMKLTLISKGKNVWYSDQLNNAARKKKIGFNELNIKSLNDSIKNIGDVVFWRSANVDKFYGKNTLLRTIHSRLIINPGIIKFPYVTYKFFQQEIVKKNLDVKTIETFIFSHKEELKICIKNKKLKFPFIVKPNLGSKGENVFLIKDAEDLKKLRIANLAEYVVQNFIENDGDFRVLVLGGKALGVIKRVAQSGSHLNNISQGGKAFIVTERKLKERLELAAAKISSFFGLTFCGVDFIIDKKTKKLHFLELNTTPQWQGFQSATGINISEKIIDLCIDLNNRNKKRTEDLVKIYYENNLSSLGDKRFHYLSRMYLWTKEDKYLRELEKERQDYLGKEIGDIEKKIQERIASGPLERTGMNNYKERLKYFKKYRNLYEITSVLFLYLFAKNIYKTNLKKLVSKHIKHEKILELRSNLIKDDDALIILSTHAINFLYLSGIYLNDIKLRHQTAISPVRLLKLAEKKYLKKESNLLLIYLLTHCIIGASEFYSRGIRKNKEVYKKMLLLIERIIKENYFNINLDNKIEFIVCAKLMSFKTIIEEVIISEAESSLSPIGNYIVDMHNDNYILSKKNDFISSEHRNVLFLMARQS